MLDFLNYTNLFNPFYIRTIANFLISKVIMNPIVASTICIFIFYKVLCWFSSLVNILR